MSIKHVPFYRLELTNREIQAVVNTLKSGWLTTGKVTRQFEKEFAAYVGARYAHAVNSCTAALHLSLLAAGVKPGDEVITTPYTFVASAEAIIHAAAIPVFVDTEIDSMNINFDLVTESINEKTSAVLPVHIAGELCDLGRLEKIRRKYKIAVIHDAAHALGSIYRSKPVGSTADYNCFSFYATKNLTTGEGGMVTLNNRKSRDLLERLSLHGMSKGAWKRYSAQGSWKYQIVEHGYKYNLSDINSSLGLVQLRNFERMQKSRRQVVEWYTHYLGDIDELSLPSEPKNSTHAWHLYIVKLRKGGEQKRNTVIEKLKACGIGTSVHFIPLNFHPYFQKTFGLKKSDFPNAYNHYKSAITLPLFTDLREDEVRYIANTFKRIFKRN